MLNDCNSQLDKKAGAMEGFDFLPSILLIIDGKVELQCEEIILEHSIF